MIQVASTGRVIGVGLNKTGTTTLGSALNMIGIDTIDYPTDPRTQEQLENGDYRLDILDKYSAVTDMPVGFFYPQLDKVYPGSRFILTVRDKNDWLKSVASHWPFVLDWCKRNKQFGRFTYYTFAVVYGSIQYNQDRYGYVYDSYVDRVNDYFRDRPDDLLVMDICAGDGWSKLCPFLGVPEPREPFPHLNAKAEKFDRRAWIDRVDASMMELSEVVPQGGLTILVDQNQLAFDPALMRRNLVPFKEKDGKYFGLPSDSADALNELLRLRDAGATHIAFAWNAFWWFDHYTQFCEHLKKHHKQLLNSENWIVFAI